MYDPHYVVVEVGIHKHTLGFVLGQEGHRHGVMENNTLDGRPN